MKENSLIIAFGSNETSLMKGEDDMYPKDFGKYISVSEESLHEAGFEKGSRHKGKAIYWVRKDVDYVLVKTRTKNTSGWVIIDKETYIEIEGKSIFMNQRKPKSPHVPCIHADGEKKSLHRYVMGGPDGTQIDHINHCQGFCVKDNLRKCTNQENSMNRYDKLGVYIPGHFYEIEVEVGNESFITELKREGFVEKRSKNGKTVKMTSPSFESIVDCYIDSTKKHKALYKGTRMEEFVYDIKNDFTNTIGLLIHCYILQDITEEEMFRMNEDYWRDLVKGNPENAKAC